MASGLQSYSDGQEQASETVWNGDMDGLRERRAHRRLKINLPLVCSPMGSEPGTAYRTVSIDVSSGGVYFEADADGFETGMTLDVEFGVPPGDGHFPYPGRVRGLGEVVRMEKLPGDQQPDGGPPTRFGIATRFREPLELVFPTDQ